MIAEGAAGSAAKSIFGPMITFLTFVYSTWRSSKQEQYSMRSSVFKEQFVPAFNRLEAVHKNYMESFHDFYELSKMFQTPSAELIAKFRRYGMEYASWREDLRCFTEVCAVLSKNSRLKYEKDVIGEFSNSIKHYFDATFPDGSRFAPSWFSSFLNQFENEARNGRSPWEEEYNGMGYTNPKGSLMRYLKEVYQVELPTRWSLVSKAKSALQSVLMVPP